MGFAPFTLRTRHVNGCPKSKHKFRTPFPQTDKLAQHHFNRKRPKVPHRLNIPPTGHRRGGQDPFTLDHALHGRATSAGRGAHVALREAHGARAEQLERVCESYALQRGRLFRPHDGLHVVASD
jgi:hypothetical protein